MIQLYQYPAFEKLTSLSPFCIKLEVYFRMNGIEFEDARASNPMQGPKGKFPYIVHKGQKIGDSSLAIQYLKKELNIRDEVAGADINGSQQHALKRMIEESLYFSLLYNRWVDEVNRELLFRGFSRFFPRGVGRLAISAIRLNLKKQAKAQGIGRHCKNEVYEMAASDIKAIDGILGNRHFFCNNGRSEVDATAYSFLKTIIEQPFHSPMKEQIRNNHNLMNYIGRMESALSTRSKNGRANCA